MGLLLVGVHVGVLLAQVYLSQGLFSPPLLCGNIYPDSTKIDDADYVCENIHTADYQSFLQRMDTAVRTHWVAYTFINSFPDSSEPPEETGSPKCPTEHKHILGYFKNYGLTLCLVVKPYDQLVKKAECCSEGSCGANTRCVPGGYVRTKYLVYCDAIYTDEHGCLIGTEELSESRPIGIDESDFAFLASKRRRDADTNNSTDTSGERHKRLVVPLCPDNEWYFSFRHDFLPSTCSCRSCNNC